MNNLKFIFSRLIFILALFSAGNSMAGDFPEKGDMDRGAKAWADNCMRCHNMRSAKELRDDQWITTTFHMRIRGGLTGQEARDILTFLQGTN